jgi:hypothetical protein
MDPLIYLSTRNYRDAPAIGSEILREIRQDLAGCRNIGPVEAIKEND